MDTFTQRQELEDQDMAIFETTHGAKPTTPPARDRTSASGGATNQSPPISFEIAQAQGSNFMGLSDECFGSHGHNYENGAHTTWPLPDTYFLPWTVPTMFTSMPPDSFLNLPLYSGVHPEYSVFQPVMPNFGSFVTDTLPTPFQGAPPNAPAILAPILANTEVQAPPSAHMLQSFSCAANTQVATKSSVVWVIAVAT
ncbi:hypothetical protein CFE70_003957 [Pyrenophora teres f. teres 0-1]